MSLQLPIRGREWWVVKISTIPAITTWQASFDNGVTWVDGEPVDGQADTYRWLVNGPSFVPDATASATVSTSNFRPRLRAVDDPEVILRRGPSITLTQ